MLALDLDDAAPQALEIVLRLFPPPRPRFALVHVYDGSSEGLAYWNLSSAEEEAEWRRRVSRDAAERRVALLLASCHRLAKGEEVAWSSSVRFGSPRMIIPKALGKRHADLLVVGTHGRSGVAQAFLGTIAGDLLRSVSCDVLAVPPRRAPKPAVVPDLGT